MDGLRVRGCWILVSLLLAGPGVAQTFFTEVTIDILLPPPWGVACGDYDNDQWPDIFLSGQND